MVEMIFSMLLTLGLAMGIGLLQAGPATAATKGAVGITPLKFQAIHGGPSMKSAPFSLAPKSAISCPPSKSELAASREKGERKVGCLQATNQSAVSKRATHQSAVKAMTSGDMVTADATSAVPALWCDSYAAGQWWYERSTSCLHDASYTWTLYDTDTGDPIGNAQMSLDILVTLKSSSPTFSETNYLTMTSEDNVPELLTTFTTMCDSQCIPVNGAGEDEEPLTEGSTISGETTFSDDPAQGTQDTTTPSFQIDQQVPNGTTLSPETGSFQPVRCDTGLITTNSPTPSTSTGCVYSDFQPTVTFSLSQTGSTVAIDDWAMTEEQAGWGSNSPLTRISDFVVRNNNRAAICDSTFTNLYTNDSCEEYPFASTTQSGGYNGLTGAQCAQVEAVQVNGQWEIEELGTVTGTEGCVRGHADKTSQNSQGGVLSSFVQQNRVIANDQYWVAITA